MVTILEEMQKLQKLMQESDKAYQLYEEARMKRIKAEDLEEKRDRMVDAKREKELAYVVKLKANGHLKYFHNYIPPNQR